MIPSPALLQQQHLQHRLLFGDEIIIVMGFAVGGGSGILDFWSLPQQVASITAAAVDYRFTGYNSCRVTRGCYCNQSDRYVQI